MSDLRLPQNDISLGRAAEVAARRAFYNFNKYAGQIPCAAQLLDWDKTEPLWDITAIQGLLKNRANLYEMVDRTGWEFTNKLTLLPTGDFVSMILNMDLLKLTPFFIFDLGQKLPNGRPTSLDDYQKVFQRIDLPEIAGRYHSDESFAYSFVAGANPAIIQRMTAVPANFPISNRELRSVPELGDDDLTQAIAEGRVYYVDFAVLNALENGEHPQQKKYIYQPLAAFCVPRMGGLMQPFAIQTGQVHAGREIYTPRDGWSWQIAKGMVHAATYSHQEMVTHLGATHLVLEAIAVCTFRNLSTAHPLHALLSSHFYGTLQINFLALNWMILPDQPFDRLTGATLNSTIELIARERRALDFDNHYLPKRLRQRGLDDTKALPMYPYRDDALLIWGAIHSWMSEFVPCYYHSDTDVTADGELQAWVREINDPDFGALQNFGGGADGLRTREQLIDVLTMIIYTAGPEHAAVNFTQRTDMSFLPAGPLAGYIPELRGRGHTQQDYLDFLPPLDVASISNEILSFLGGLYYDVLGDYGGAFDSDFGVLQALKRFRRKLAQCEQTIVAADRLRPWSYPHLRPSKIPQSTNI